MEANLSKESSLDQTAQSIIGTVLSPEQGALLVGSQDTMTLLALKEATGHGCIIVRHNCIPEALQT